MHHRLLALATLVGLFAAAAQAGELKPVACTEKTLAVRAPYHPVVGGKLGDGTGSTASSPSSGTVCPQAKVDKFKLGDLQFMVALDSDQSDAAKIDVIRFDFTGTGKFTKANSIKMAPAQGMTGQDYYLFDLTTLQVPMGGKTVPLSLSGGYSSNAKNTFIYLSTCFATEGDCDFGGTNYRVRVIDADGNLKAADPGKITTNEFGGFKQTGDKLVVYLGDGSTTRAATEPRPNSSAPSGSRKSNHVRTAPLGQPVLVDGAWYTVSVAKGGSSISAAKVTIPAGRLHIDNESWNCTLVGLKYAYELIGGKDPVDLPADEYRILNYRQQVGPADAKGNRPSLMCSPSAVPKGQTAKLFEVAAGKTLDVLIGTPLSAKIDATVEKGDMQIALSIFDAGGYKISQLYSPGAKLAAPAVEVVDSDGKTVHRASLEYG